MEPNRRKLTDAFVRTVQPSTKRARSTREQMNRLQDHEDGGIASVYDRHGYADEKRRIQEK